MQSLRVWTLVLCAVSLPAQDDRAVQLRQRIDALIEELRSGNDDERQDASDELARLSTPAALPLVEHYLHASREEWLDAWTVGKVLVAMGPGGQRAAERLLEEIGREDGKTYERALLLLVEFGPWHRSLRERLAELSMPDDATAARMAKAGGYTDSLLDALVVPLAMLRARAEIDPRCSCEDLIALLERDDARQVEFVAQLLGARGAEASAAVPRLVHALDLDYAPINVDFGRITHFRDPGIRHAIIDALVAIAPRDPRAVRAHLAQLSRHNPKRVRLRAARAIAAMGAEAAGAVPDLIRCRNSWNDDDIMREIVVALGAIGAAADSAVPMLEELVRDVKFDDELVAAARLAITEIRGR